MKNICLRFTVFIFILIIQDLQSQIIPKSKETENNHYCSRSHTKKSNIREPFFRNSDKSSTSFLDLQKRLSCNDNVETWSLYGSAELVNQLAVITDYECLRPMWSFDTDNSIGLYDSQKVDAVANEIQNLSSGYDGTLSSGVYGMLIYLQTAAYHDFFESSYSLSSSNKLNIKNACVALAASPNIRLMTDENLKVVSILLKVSDADTIRQEEEIIALLNFLMFDAVQTDSWKTLPDYQQYLETVNSIFFLMFRGESEQAFLDAIVENSDFFERLAEMTIDPELMNHDELSLLSSNAVLEYTRLMKHFPETIQPGLIDIINTYERLSQEWVMAMDALNTYGDCTATTQCEDQDQIEEELYDLLFPNTFNFDDGKLVVNTPLDEAEVQQLYHAAKEVQAGFFNVLGTDLPVTNDTNETLYMYVFGSYEEYTNYAGMLFGIPTDNGGMYLERISTFYTWDREVGVDSSLSLEALFRHEYTHYLQGRYLVPGYWGETELYENGRLVWYEEGMAEFFTGSTDTDGIRLIEQSARTVRDTPSEDWPAIEEVFNSNYSSGNFYYYPYGNMIWYHWYLENQDLMKSLFEATRNNDVVTFDQLIDNQKINGQANFENFLTAVKNSNIPSWEPTTYWLPAPEVDVVSLTEIKDSFESLTGISTTAFGFESFEMNKRFQLEGTISGNDPFNALKSVLEVLEDDSSANNFDIAVGYLKNNNGSSADFIITGPLKEADPNLPEPQVDIISHVNDQEIMIGEPQTFVAEVAHSSSILSAELLLNGVSLGIINDADYIWNETDFIEATAGYQTLELIAVDDFGVTGRKTINLNLVFPQDSLPSGYCDAMNLSNDSFIRFVSVGDIINQESGHDSYMDYTDNHIITLTREENSFITIETSDTDSWTYNDIEVWVDWNRDGDFNDEGENVISIYGPGPYQNLSFTVPETAQIGLSRMRIRYSYGDENAATSCGIDEYFGEVEDYGIRVIENLLSVNDNSHQNNSLIVYPNPSNDRFYLHKTNNKNDYEQIQIYNINGQIVETYAGYFDIEYFGEDLLPGIYIMKILNMDNTIFNSVLLKE